MAPSLDDHLFAPGRKRILSLDGGGVRGLVTIGLLERVETILAARSPEPREFRLSDYFDLIGGTSTGGIIATLLALGYRTREIRELYRDLCPKIFTQSIWRQLMSVGFVTSSKFDPSALDREIAGVLADVMRRAGRSGQAEPTLGTDLLRTGLALFTKRIDTGAVWNLTNNARSRYWDPDSLHWTSEDTGDNRRFFANRDYSLRHLVRATASAPFYLDAVDIDIDPEQRGLFLDGGVSPFNNPALQLFLMATLRHFDAQGRATMSPFGFDWQNGADNIFLLSIGTGGWRKRQLAARYRRSTNIWKAMSALIGVIDDCMKTSDVWLQALSEPADPHHIDAELGLMRNLRVTREPLLTFKRVNPQLEPAWLEAELGLALGQRALDNTRALDNAKPANLTRLAEIGTKAGERLISEADLPALFDPEAWRPAAAEGAPSPLAVSIEPHAPPRFVVGVVGHRPNRLTRDPVALARDIDHVLASLAAGAARRAEGPARPVALSALAEGADRLFAERARAAGFRLSAILPFGKEDYEQTFEDAGEIETYRQLVAGSAEVVELPGSLKDREAAYERVGHEIVARSDVLVAVWDGGVSAGPGGTTEVVRKARTAGIAVVVVSAAETRAVHVLGEPGAATGFRLEEIARTGALRSARQRGA